MTLGFVLAEPARVELTVFTVDGRVVRRFEVEPGVRGENSLVWDGTDGDGRPVASGVYLYRLRAGSRTEAQRMLVLD